MSNSLWNCEYCLLPYEIDEQKEVYASLKAPYGSELDSIMFPICFCSLTCMLSALAKDAEQAKKFNIGSWHPIDQF